MFLKADNVPVVFPGVPVSVPGSREEGGGERRWEALMGNWASALGPPLESSLKGLER